MHIIPSPCPNHIFDALMWKICTQEPRGAFSSPLTVLQVRIFRVLSSRFFILRWYAEIGSRILSSRNCSGQDESLKRELVWFRQCHFLATHFSNIPVRFSLRNRHAQTWNLQIMLPNFQTVIPGMQPMKLPRQLEGCSPAVACQRSKHLESLYHHRDTLWSWDASVRCMLVSFTYHPFSWGESWLLVSLSSDSIIPFLVSMHSLLACNACLATNFKN